MGLDVGRSPPPTARARALELTLRLLLKNQIAVLVGYFDPHAHARPEIFRSLSVSTHQPYASKDLLPDKMVQIYKTFVVKVACICLAPGLNIFNTGASAR